MLDVVRPGLLLDDLQRLLGDLLGALDARAVGGAEAELELAGVHARENLPAQLAADQPDHQAGRHDR